MPDQPLSSIPDGSDVFIDANIFIYAMAGQSQQCVDFLERCSREDVYGLCLFEIVNEATHRFMLAEAYEITKPSTNDLKRHSKAISSLTEYWKYTERILDLNLLIVPSEERMLRTAQNERMKNLLLTNDSIIVACMRNYGVSMLATRDLDFDSVADIDTFGPNDLV